MNDAMKKLGLRREMAHVGRSVVCLFMETSKLCEHEKYDVKPIDR